MGGMCLVAWRFRRSWMRLNFPHFEVVDSFYFFFIATPFGFWLGFLQQEGIVSHTDVATDRFPSWPLLVLSCFVLFSPLLNCSSTDTQNSSSSCLYDGASEGKAWSHALVLDLLSDEHL